GAEPLGDDHALVDQRAGREADDVEAHGLRQAALADLLVGLLADDEKLALERLGIGAVLAALHEDLADHRLDRLDALAQNLAVDRHVAPEQELLALGGDVFLERRLADLAALGETRQEYHADGIFAGRRQLLAGLLGLFLEHLVRNLDEDARAVARQRVGRHGAAMGEVAEDAQTIGHDLVALAVLDVGDEADAAGVMLVAPIIKAVATGHRSTQKRETPAKKLA